MSETSSSGKSKEEVAFDILAKLKGVGIWGENNKDVILDMYAECLVATSGNRGVFTQQKPVAAAPRQQAAPTHTGPRPQSAAEIAAAANLEAFALSSTATQGGQAVHEQQAQLNQAFKPGS